MAFAPVLRPPYSPGHVFLCSPLAGTSYSVEPPDEIIVALSRAQAQQTYEEFWGTCASSVLCLADLRQAANRFVQGVSTGLADVVVRADSGSLEAYCVMVDLGPGESGAGHEVRPLLVYAQGAEQALEGTLSKFEGATLLAVHPASSLLELVRSVEGVLDGEGHGVDAPVVAMQRVEA